MIAREAFNVHHLEINPPTSVREAGKGCSLQALKLYRVLRLQRIRLYLREEHYRLGSLKVPAVLSLVSKATENNHNPFPLEQQKATTIRARNLSQQ